MDDEKLRAKLIAACKGFDEDPACRIPLDAVERVFREHPGLTERAVVEAKVGFLDSLYSTNIRFASRKKDGPRGNATTVLAGWIARNNRTLTRLLERGDPGAVRMLEVDHGLGKHLYSFATKFAHFQAPDAFPIWDSRADRSIHEIQRVRPLTGGINAPRGEYWYSRWTENVREVGRFIEAPDFRETDKALYWWNGDSY